MIKFWGGIICPPTVGLGLSDLPNIGRANQNCNEKSDFFEVKLVPYAAIDLIQIPNAKPAQKAIVRIQFLACF